MKLGEKESKRPDRRHPTVASDSERDRSEERDQEEARPPVPIPRRSGRERRKPAWFDAYQVNQQTLNRFFEMQIQNNKLLANMLTEEDNT